MTIQIQQLSLSFTTAKTLRGRMDQLPKGPEWKMQDILMDGYRTVKPVTLFYRDPLECIQALLQNPIFEGKWAFTPQRIYDNLDRQNRLYSEWVTSDGAWAAQVGSLHYFCNAGLTCTSLLSPQVEHYLVLPSPLTRQTSPL